MRFLREFAQNTSVYLSWVGTTGGNHGEETRQADALCTHGGSRDDARGDAAADTGNHRAEQGRFRGRAHNAKGIEELRTAVDGYASSSAKAFDALAQTTTASLDRTEATIGFSSPTAGWMQRWMR